MWIVSCNPVLMKILLNSILVSPVNNTRDSLFKTQTCWKNVYSATQTNIKSVFFFFFFPISALEMLLNFAILNQSSMITVMSLVLCFNFQTPPKRQLLCSIAFSSGCIIYKILLKIFRIELMSLLLACYSL